MTTLFYVHDPMCSWCWAFRPVYAQLQQGLADGVASRRLLGGLAADTDNAMPAVMQAQLQATWRRIQQQLPATQFNFDFWTHCQPRRSTYPACRAVIAAREQGEVFDERMTTAIQQAYYLQARNPSDYPALSALADELGLDVDAFNTAIHSARVEAQLQAEIGQARQWGVDSMPALLLLHDNSCWHIPLDYQDAAPMLEMIDALRDDPSPG